MKVLRNRIAIHGAGNRMTLGGIDEVAKFMSKHFTPLLRMQTWVFKLLLNG